MAHSICDPLRAHLLSPITRFSTLQFVPCRRVLRLGLEVASFFWAMSSPIPGVVQQLVDMYIDDLPALFATKYVAAAALVVVLYDWLLTLDDEVRLIYPGLVSLIKVFHITVRS